MTEKSLIRCRFPENEFVLIPEVEGGGRRADWMAINMWPSRGYRIHTIEVKRSRNDWLNELKQPGKNDFFYKYSNHFWLFTHGDGIAKIDEIPENWGWITVKGDKTKVMKQAPKLEPLDIPKSFMVAMLQRMQTEAGKLIHPSTIEDRIKSEREAARQSALSERTTAIQDYKHLREQVEKFELASGIKISGWGDAEGLGNAVNSLNRIDTFLERNMNKVQDALNSMLPHVATVLEYINSQKGKPADETEA